MNRVLNGFCVNVFSTVQIKEMLFSTNTSINLGFSTLILQ